MAFLLALALGFFWPVLFTDRALFSGDVLLGIYPAHDLWQRYVSAGRLPVWNPYIFNGLPFLADPEFSTFYPSMALNLFLPPHRALAVDLAAHFFLTSVLTYLYLRQQGLRGGPALLGAVSFGFSGFLAVRVGQVNLIRTITWTPLLLLLLARSSFPRAGRYLLGMAVVLTMQLLAGHVQTVVISTLLLAAFGLWRAAQGNWTMPARTVRMARAAAVLAVPALGALLLAAVQVLPALELAEYSNRPGSGYTYATSFSLPLRQAPMLLIPNLLGSPQQGGYWGRWVYWEMIGYTGVVTFLLAVFGLILSPRRDRFFWGGIGLAGVLLAFGGDTPLYRLAYTVVPGLAYFRVPARFLLWFAFGSSVLAAYGADRLLSLASVSRRGWRITAVGCAVVGGLALYGALGGPGVRAALSHFIDGAIQLERQVTDALRREIVTGVTDVGLEAVRRFALLWIGAFGAAVAISIGRLRSTLGVSLLLALAIGDAVTFGMTVYPTVRAEELYREVPTRAFIDLEDGRYRILTTRNYWFYWLSRVAAVDAAQTVQALLPARTGFVPNTPITLQISNAAGYSPIVVDRVLEFVDASIADAERRGGSSPLLDFQAARYILSRANLGGLYTPVYQTDTYAIWRNDRALPRGYLVTRFEIHPEDRRLAQRLLGGWDPTRVVLLSERPQETYGLQPHPDPGRVTARAYGPTRLTFELALRGPAIFVLSDTYYPGWTALVDGRPHPILRANLAFQAVVLPPAARHLEFVFQPRTAIAGGLISVTGWLALIGLAAVLAVTPRRGGASAGRPGAGGAAGGEV